MNTKSTPSSWAGALSLALLLALGACSTSTDTTQPPDTTVAASVPSGAPPEEPGPFGVGRTTVELTDPARDGRLLTTDIWYPVDPSSAAEAPASVYEFLPGLEFDAILAVSGVPVSSSGPFPLVVFSHGSGGLRWQSAFFTEVLASHGFVVVSADHAGNTAVDSITGAAVADEQAAIDRPADASFLLDAVLAGANGAPADLIPAIDPDRVGIGGHSFGGYTGLAAASGRSGFTADPRIDAVLGFAAYTRLLPDAELESVDVPTMLVSGTLDTTTPIAADTERPWDLVPGRPLYRVDLTGAGHQSFTDVCAYQELGRTIPDAPELVVAYVDELATAACTPDFLPIATAHQLIVRYGVAFMEAHVAGDEAATEWLTPAAAAANPEVQFQVKS